MGAWLASTGGVGGGRGQGHGVQGRSKLRPWLQGEGWIEGRVRLGLGWQFHRAGKGRSKFSQLTGVSFLLFLTRRSPVGWDTHRSWPGGGGGRPRALVAGEGWGGKGLGRFWGEGPWWIGGGGKGRAWGGFQGFRHWCVRRTMAFFKGCPVGWGGIPVGAGLVEGGGRPGPWLQGRVEGAGQARDRARPPPSNNRIQDGVKGGKQLEVAA